METIIINSKKGISIEITDAEMPAFSALVDLGLSRKEAAKKIESSRKSLDLKKVKREKKNEKSQEKKFSRFSTMIRRVYLKIYNDKSGESFRKIWDMMDISINASTDQNLSQQLLNESLKMAERKRNQNQ